MRSIRRLALFSLTLAACRTQQPAPRAALPPTLAVPEAPATGEREVLVRAREAPRMPRCEATDAITAATLSSAVPAAPSIARRRDGAIVAFVAADRGGVARINLLQLDASGSPADESGNMRSLIEIEGDGPAAYPSLIAREGGYLLAWRVGAPGRQRIMTASLDARGRPQEAPRAHGSLGWYGAPTLYDDGGSWSVTVAASDARSVNAGSEGGAAWAEELRRFGSSGAPQVATAPPGAAWDGRAPIVAGARVYATAARRAGPADGERALLLPFSEGGPTLVARDLDHPAGLPSDGGVLLAWRARMTRHDASIRSVWFPAAGEPESPPVTLSTYRGAFDARVTLTPMGAGRVGALTISTLADDAGGSLNLSLLDARGGYIGRASVLTSFPVRASGFSVASPPPESTDDAAWVAVDGRDSEGGAPRLLIVRTRCDTERFVEALDVSPGTFVQDLNDPEPAPLRLSRAPSELRCNARATGSFTPHLSGVDDVSALTSGAVSVGASSATLLAVVKTGAGARARLLGSALDLQTGRATAPWTIAEDATRVLAAEPIVGGTVVVAGVTAQGIQRVEVVVVRGAAAVRSRLPGLRDATSAAVLPQSGAAYVVATNDAGEVVLTEVRLGAARPGAPSTVCPLRAGDEVLDVIREGAETRVLLARPDPMGRELGQSIAQVVLRDGARTAADPFADPMGHARGSALWHRAGAHLSLLYDERSALRLADVSTGVVRDARSTLEVLAGGGALRSFAWRGSDRVVALATGFGDDGADRGVTLALLDERGEARGLSTRYPEGRNAIASSVVLGANERDVVMLHLRNEAAGRATWAWTVLSCGPNGGAR